MTDEAIQESLRKHRSIILAYSGESRTGNTRFYKVLVPLPTEGGPLLFANISLHAAKIASLRYNNDLQAVGTRISDYFCPDFIATSLGIHHFEDGTMIVASVF